MAKKVNLKITERCMGQCSCCKDRMAWYAEKAEVGYVSDTSLEFARQMIDEAVDTCWEYFVFSGGEPTLVPYLPELVEYAVQRGLTTQINTNGWNITPTYLNRMAKAGLHILMLSLYSFDPDIFYKLRGSRPMYQRALDAVKHLGCFVEQNPDILTIRLQVVITRHNFRELPKLLQFALDSKFDALSTSYLENAVAYPDLCLSVSDIQAFRKNIIPELLRVIDKTTLDAETKMIAQNAITSIFTPANNSTENYSHGIYRPDGIADCNYHNNFVGIYPNGDVTPCCAFEYIRAPQYLEKINGKTLNDILSGNIFKEFWAKSFEFCRYCPAGMHVWIPTK